MTSLIKGLKEDQIRLANVLAKIEVPITANDLVEKYGFRESYISSGLRGLTMKNVVMKVGKSPPINGRPGQILWTLTKPAMSELDGTDQVSEEDFISNECDQPTYDAVRSFVETTEELLSAKIMAKRIPGLNEVQVRTALRSLCQDGLVVKITDGIAARWISTKRIATLREVEFSTPNVSRDFGSSVSFSQIVANIVVEQGPVSVKRIARMTGKSDAAIHVTLQNIATRKGFTKTKTIGAYGARTYWSTKGCEPYVVRAI